MKLEDKIEYYSDNLDNEAIRSEATVFASNLRRKGNILFYIGLIITISSLIAFITLSIIFLIKKEISFYQFIPFGIMLVSIIPLYIGVYYRKLSQIILEK